LENKEVTTIRYQVTSEGSIF